MNTRGSESVTAWEQRRCNSRHSAGGLKARLDLAREAWFSLILLFPWCRFQFSVDQVRQWRPWRFQRCVHLGGAVSAVSSSPCWPGEKLAVGFYVRTIRGCAGLGMGVGGLRLEDARAPDCAAVLFPGTFLRLPFNLASVSGRCRVDDGLGGIDHALHVNGIELAEHFAGFTSLLTSCRKHLDRALAWHLMSTSRLLATLPLAGTDFSIVRRVTWSVACMTDWRRRRIARE